MKRLLLLAAAAAATLAGCETVPVSLSYEREVQGQRIGAGYETGKGISVHVSGK